MESSFFAHKFNRFLVGAAIVASIIALGAYAHAMLESAKHGAHGPNTISVTGEGEILAKPDIGNFTFSVRADGTDAASAQEASGERMNEILAYLKGEGVDESDIKTQFYNLNPKYKWEPETCPQGFCPNRERVIDGYEVNQTVAVKVRDLDQSGVLIGGVGERGATNISSLQFTIDDESVLQAEAREAAIDDAKDKARELARSLRVHLGDVVSFYENEGYYPQPYYAETRAFSLDAAIEEAEFAPELPVGENIIKSQVTVTYEIY